MVKRSRISGGGGGLAAGVIADEEEESETCKGSRQRRRCGGISSGNHLSRLDHDLLLEIAARLPSPSDARSLALASAELYSAIRPSLTRLAFLAGYLRRGVHGAPRCPPGFFVSTSRMICRHRRRRRRDGPAPPDTVFVRGPRNILRGYNVVDPATFRAFLATAKRRRACVVASSGSLLLCAHADGGGARYSVVNPATDLWISLPPPPPGIEEAAVAFHCGAGTELTVACLAPAARRRHRGHLVVHWFTSASGRWRSTPAAARGDLRPAAAAAACAGGSFYWMLVNAGGCDDMAGGSKWPQKRSPCAVLEWDMNTAESREMTCPRVAVAGGEEPSRPLPQGLVLLREDDGLLRYCLSTRYPYPNRFCSRQKLEYDYVYLHVWTLEAAAGNDPAATVRKWRWRMLGDGGYTEARAGEGVDAEFWTWVLYNNIQAAAMDRAEDVVAGHTYDVFRYSPDSTG